MIVMDYKDAGAYMMIFFALAAIAILIPVLWVGDIGIYLVSTLFSHPPRIAYIITWILFCGLYYFIVLEGFVARMLMAKSERFEQLVVYYAQGLFFAYILSLNGLAKWSLLPIKIINFFIGGIIRWLLG